MTFWWIIINWAETTSGIMFSPQFSGQSNCYSKVSRSHDYAGTAASTMMTGMDCMDWSKQSEYTADYMPEQTLKEAKNYCRNPDKNHFNPWCYINEDLDWDYCDVPACKSRKLSILVIDGPVCHLNHRPVLSPCLNSFYSSLWDNLKSINSISTTYYVPWTSAPKRQIHILMQLTAVLLGNLVTQNLQKIPNISTIGDERSNIFAFIFGQS